MKCRESGVPEEAYWEMPVDPPAILDGFGLGPPTGDVAEL